MPGASETKLKFAIVGCGRISQKHFDALRSGALSAEVVAACDIQEERRNSVKARYQIPVYSDYIEMMKKHPEVDVVSVLTPSGLHSRHVIELADFQKHIIVEKPMALSPQDAEAMVKKCAEAGIRFFIVKQNRTNPPVVELKQALESQRFGKLVLGTTRVRWCRTQKYYDQDKWRGTKSMDGGVLYNQASHHVDLLSWLMGDVKSVFAYASKRLVDIETEDTIICNLRFKNGALGIIEATTATRPIDLEGSVSVLGEKGSVEVGGFAVNEMKIWNFSDEKDSEAALKIKENPPNVYGYGHARYLANVIRSITENKSYAVEGEAGVKSIRLIDAIYRSVDSGAEVQL